VTTEKSTNLFKFKNKNYVLILVCHFEAILSGEFTVEILHINCPQIVSENMFGQDLSK